MSGIIRDAIEKLVRLQNVDLEIIAIKTEKSHLPSSLKIFQEKSSRFKNELEKTQQFLKQKQMDQKKFELDMQAKTDQIAKYQTQMIQIKTNKEYQAMEAEIQKVRKDIGAVEEQAIMALDEIDAARATSQKAQEEYDATIKELNAQKAVVDERIKELDERLASLEGNRKDLAREIEPRSLSLYERILKNKNGAAIVAIRHRICGGCNMSITPNTENSVLRFEHLVQCDNCARIIYVEDHGA